MSATITATGKEFLVEGRGIEPLISACKTDVFPLALTPHVIIGGKGWHRTHHPPHFKAAALLFELHPHIGDWCGGRTRLNSFADCRLTVWLTNLILKVLHDYNLRHCCLYEAYPTYVCEKH